jgi:trigger factor
VSVSVTETSQYERTIAFTVTNEQLEPAMTVAARKLAHEVKIPGFRPGRAPRKMVEQAVGVERMRSEALDEMLGELAQAAITEADLEPAATPNVENIEPVDDGFEVAIKVALWPALEALPNYVGREIEVAAVEVAEEEVDEHVIRMRSQFASTEEVDRPSESGDYVVLNLTGTQDGEEVEELKVDGFSYELGSGILFEGMDENLTGVEKGSTVEFDTTMPEAFGEAGGEAARITAEVVEVRVQILPDFTDEWVSEQTEFDSISEFKESLERRLGQQKLNTSWEAYRTGLLNALVEEIDIDVPEGIVRGEMDQLLHNFVARLEEQDITLPDYFEATGLSQEQMVADLTQQGEYTVKVDLILDAVVDDAGVELEDGELDNTISAFQSMGEAEDSDFEISEPHRKRISTDILRQKAMDSLTTAAVPMGDDGNAIDFKALAAELADPEEDEEIEEIDDQVVDSEDEARETATSEEE